MKIPTSILFKMTRDSIHKRYILKTKLMTFLSEMMQMILKVKKMVPSTNLIKVFKSCLLNLRKVHNCIKPT